MDTSHPFTHYREVIERAKEISRAGQPARVAVAAAQEDDLLSALYQCKQVGIADAVLIGVHDQVNAALDSAHVPRDAFPIEKTSGDEESAVRTAQIAGAGEADVVMKGYIKTSTLLKTLLKREHGLRDQELLSHSAVLYVPSYGKFLNITDGGTLVAPTLDQKVVILRNALIVMQALGIQRPRVAVAGPSDEVEEQLPETSAAHELVVAARKEHGDSVLIDGPMTLAHAARPRQQWGAFDNDTINGDADIYLVHTLEEGNIIAKTLIQFANAVFMGVITGARIPISLVSRSDTMINKLASVALAVCIAEYQKSAGRE